MAGKLAGVEAFQFVLQKAGSEMAHTAARLSDRDTGAETQQLEQDVLQRLQELIEALKQDQPPSNSRANQQAGSKNGPNGAIRN